MHAVLRPVVVPFQAALLGLPRTFPITQPLTHPPQHLSHLLYLRKRWQCATYLHVCSAQSGQTRPNACLQHRASRTDTHKIGMYNSDSAVISQPPDIMLMCYTKLMYRRNQNMVRKVISDSQIEQGSTLPSWRTNSCSFTCSMS